VTADKSLHAYVAEAREDLHNYAQGLLRENERLRAVAATLESDKRRLELGLEHGMAELGRLRVRLEEVQEDNAQANEEYQRIEQQSSNLSNLYVASYQLHSSVNRSVVLKTIEEIVINLIGSEEIVIFARDRDGYFRMASAVGIDEWSFAPFRLGEGPIGRYLIEGNVFINPAAVDHNERLTACVPLKIGETIIGAIAVFRLLAHKTALEPLDRELFGLLAVHAATALYCATLHEESVAREAVA
jgi:GAF domain-containing protein